MRCWRRFPGRGTTKRCAPSSSAARTRCFCAGLDLDIVRGKPGIETKKFLERLYFALNDTQYRMGKPTIAAVDGAVRAGGMTIAISCDMIIAGDASYLRLSRDRCRPDPGDSLRATAAAGRQASGVWTAVPRRALRCRDRLSHGIAERGRAEGDCAGTGARGNRTEARCQIADRHEDRARRLHAGGRRRFPAIGRKRRREFCAGRKRRKIVRKA